MRRKTPRRRVACVKREIWPVALAKNECWSMDFVSDQLFNDHRLRVLVIIETFTRECLALDVNTRIRGIDVATTLERITRKHGFPKRIKVDNGPNLFRRILTGGHTGIMLNSTLADQVDHLIMHWLKHSTLGFDKSVSISTGFSRWMMQD